MALFREVGPLRLLVAAIALATVPGVLFSVDPRGSITGLLIGAVAPGVAFFLIWAIPFDALMARVFMADAAPDRRRLLRRVIAFDGIVWGALLLIWFSFFASLISGP